MQPAVPALVLKSRIQGGSVRAVTAACMLAVSPATLALAQQAAEPADLAPIVVEGQKAKQKKRPVAAKKAPAPVAKQAAPAPQPPPVEAVEATAQPVPSSGSIGPGTGQPADSFKVDNLQSGKATAPLLYTPQTVTVVPAEILKERGSTNLTQALRNTPGITFEAGENGFSTSTNNFKIRGIDTSGSIFIDGVRDNGVYARDMFNVDRVEVIKGAASDNGRGGAAGYVNIVSKTPAVEDFFRGEASLSFDDYGGVRERATLDINRRVGTAAVRLNGMIEDGDIYGRDEAEVSALGLAPSLALGLGTDTRVIFSYEHLERRDLPDWGIYGAMASGLDRYDPRARGASRTNFYGLASDYDDVTAQSALGRIEHDINDNWSISNQTRLSWLDREARYTVPTGFTAPATGGTQTQFYDRQNDSISNQTNLTGRFYTGPFKHTLSTGMEFSWENSDADRFNAPTSSTNIFNPNPNRNVAFPGVILRNAVDIDTAAVYLYDTIDITRQWALTGGVRVEHYNVEIASKNVPSGTGAGPFDGYDDSETTVGGKLGVVYKPVQNGSIYAAWGISALPPGSFLSNPDISRNNDNQFPGFIPGADPVQAENFEIGTKWDWFGGKLSTTAAAFHTTKSNVPYGNNALFSGIAYGEQVVKGIELGVAGELTSQWKVFGGLTVLDSERKHGRDVDIAGNTGNPPFMCDYCPVGPVRINGFNGATTTDGDELAFTPNFFANLWTTYDVTDKFTVGGGFLYVAESYLGRPDDALRLVPNGKFGKLPDYFVVNAMVSYDLTDNVELRFNVDNVFAEDYVVSSNWDGSRVQLGDPRVYRLSTSVDF